MADSRLSPHSPAAVIAAAAAAGGAYLAALAPSAADTMALSILDSTHHAASWLGRAICGRSRAPFLGARSWCAVPTAALASRLILFVGVVDAFRLSGAFRRAGGKL